MRCGWTIGNQSGGYPMNRAAVRKKAEALLRRADVTEGIREHFAVAANFTPVDGAQMLVKHIRGEIEHERTVVTKDGVEKINEKIPPSLDALKHYHSLALPKPAKQVQVDQRVVVAKALISEQAPQIRVRELKPADEV